MVKVSVPVTAFTVFLSFVVGTVIFALLSLTCSFFHGFFLGFIVPLQWLVSLVSDYHVQGFTPGWERAGFVFGVLCLLDCIRRKGVFTLTATLKNNDIEYTRRVL